MKICVRNACLNDREDIVNFQLEMARETEGIYLSPDILVPGVEAVLTDPAKGQYYVAEHNGQIVGSLLTTFEWSDWRNGTVLWIQSVYVIPSFRRKGIYSRLYTHVKELVIKDDHLKGIRLYADKTNVNAHQAYRKLGMSPDHYVTFEWMK